MAPEKVTDMVLNVDLKCSYCYKKVKKIICKIPQIRDQVFDVDKNAVKIRVVCCSPEKIRDKLCYKGGGAIQSIKIIEIPKKTKPKPGANNPKDAGKLKEPETPKELQKPKSVEKPEFPEKKPAEHITDLGKAPEPDKGKPKDAEKTREIPKRPDAGPNPNVAKMVYEPVHGYLQIYPPSRYPMVGHGQHYDHGYDGAPFQHGYGMPIATPSSYGGFGYDNGYDRYNGNWSHYTSNDYGGQEEGEGCLIM